MNIKKINRKINKKYPGRFSAFYNPANRSIVMEGEAQDWQQAIDACRMAVVGGDIHVVNHIQVPSIEIPQMRLPLLKDTALQGEKVDVLVIGGGIVGAAVLRELSKWKISALLVEKESDLAMQASGRNDGEVHPGVDQKKKNLKLKYELLGNRMYDRLCADLGVPFRRNGQIVAIKGRFLKPVLQALAKAKRALGVKDTRVISKQQLYNAVPNLKKGYDIGLFNASAGTVCPFGLCIAYGENAIANGAQISLNTAVLSMEVENRRIVSVKTNRGTIFPKVVVNAAGVFADKVAAMARDEFFSIHPRRGTDAILDSERKDLTDKIVSYRKIINKEINTKGGGIMQTVHGNILIGPNAQETYERENYATEAKDIAQIFSKQRKTIPTLSEKDIITYFAGVRAPSFEEDFIIEKGRETENIVHAAAIQSPGLTAAPAIALDVEKMVVQMLGDVQTNASFNPVRVPIPVLKEMDEQQRDSLIRSNPDYGIIVCRCEEISKGEILDCLKSPLCVPTLDGIKRRVRPGMGRCQGGFCSPAVSRIVAGFMGIKVSDVTKNGAESKVTYGEIK